MNIKIRICYGKHGTLRYVGHLDFLRVFQQALRRARLPVAHSQGFNPHMLLSFALPLPLGMDSVRDYADLTLTGRCQNRHTQAHLCACPQRGRPDCDLREWQARLQAHAPAGLVIHDMWETEGPGAAALVAAADYGLATALSPAAAQQAVAAILDAPTLVVSKKTKSGIKDVDIRPDIFDLRLGEEAPGGTHVFMQLAAGSGRFLNPLTVAALLPGERPGPGHLRRLELYRARGAVWEGLGEKLPRPTASAAWPAGAPQT